MTESFIPYGRQAIDESDIAAVSEVLRSDWLTTGPVVKRFEQALANITKAKYCIVFNSGTAALHAAYFTTGLKTGEEIITTPITFAATANAALYLGTKPVFADIAENSFHIDPDKVEASINNKTKIIAPVDMAGMPAPLDEVMELARANNLVVVEDACHALGANYKDRTIGSVADLTCFSFHPVKNITTGEGGAVTTDNEDYYQQLLKFRSHGIVKDNASLEITSSKNTAIEKNYWYYEQQLLGFNYRLPDINCALGLSQLNRLEKFIQRRREIVSRYNEAFKDNPNLLIPPSPFGKGSLNSSAWHLYILRLTGKDPQRDMLATYLYDQAIGTQVHYIPVYMHPYYRKLGYKAELCPIAEDYFTRCLTIPLFPAMTDQDVERVIEAVNKYFK